jgi:hypothetical protein
MAGVNIGGTTGTAEHGIAAIEQRLDLRVAERFEPGAEFGHRDAISLADVHAAEQDDESGHM